MKRAFMLSLACCSLAACTMRMEARPTVPPPPPMAPQMMSYEEAVERASIYARDRGYGYRLQEAHLANGRVWYVNFRIFEQERPGRLHLEYDAFSRQLLSADARLGRRHGEDNDEWENDDHHDRHRRREGERDDD